MDAMDFALMMLIIGCGAWCALILHIIYNMWSGGY